MPMGIGLGIGVTRGGGVGWWPAGSELALEFDNQRGFNSIDRTKTTPNSILTYTNPSAKLVYGSDGVLRYAPHNLLTYSEQFDNAAWTKSDVTVSANAIAAPNGTVTADQIVESATTAVHRALTAIFTLSAVPYTFSIRVKKNLTRRLYVNADTLMGVRSLFDLSAGTVVSTLAGSATIADIGNDYWLITVTGTGTGASNRVYLQINRASSGSAVDDNYAGDGASGIYVWGAQLQRTPNHSNAYIPTTTAAVYSLPIDHDPITHAPLGVLIEEQRTNLLTYSEQFDNADWAKTNATISSNVEVAPDGTTTADELIGSGVLAPQRASQNPLVTGVHTFTVYAKANTNSFIQLLQGSDAGFFANFDLSTGTVGTKGASTTSSIQDIGGGWYRCSATWTIASSAAHRVCLVDGAAVVYGAQSATTNSVYIWGAQLEAGAFATSYIPTVSQATRLADQVSILTSAFGYNATAGTVATEYYDSGINSALWRIDDGGDNNYFRAIRDTGSMVASAVYGGVAYPVYLTATAKGMPTKYAAGWDAASINAAINGTLGTANTSLILPTVLIFRVGNNRNAQFYNSHIKRLTYFPTRRSNADLQVLTRGDDLVWGIGDYLVWGSGNNLTW